jgi:hypothetical protein
MVGWGYNLTLMVYTRLFTTRSKTTQVEEKCSNVKTSKAKEKGENK